MAALSSLDRLNARDLKLLGLALGMSEDPEVRKVELVGVLTKLILSRQPVEATFVQSVSFYVPRPRGSENVRIAACELLFGALLS